MASGSSQAALMCKEKFPPHRKMSCSYPAKQKWKNAKNYVELSSRAAVGLTGHWLSALLHGIAATKQKMKKRNSKPAANGCNHGTVQPKLMSPSNGASATKGQGSTDVFYWARNGKYFMRDNRGDWVIGTRQDAADYLVDRFCFKRRMPAGLGLSPADRELLRIRSEQSVDYASPLAGYRRGYYPDLNGNAVLVTKDPNIFVPARGPWPLIGRILRALLADPAHAQVTFFHGWAAETCKSLKSGEWRPGQILGLIGRSSSGKGLLQSIITEMTGGREADPSLYLARSTSFNGELFTAEHLRISDQIVPHSNSAARHLANGLKQIAANRTHKLHDKHKCAIDLPVFWRCTISLNDGPEDLTVLPRMDNGMADKFMLFKCSEVALSMPTETVAQEVALWKKIVKEVPHYVYWLLYEFKLPNRFKSRRYGVTHFHHPEIVSRLPGALPEEQLLHLIDSIGPRAFDGGTKPWTGTTNELQGLLRHVVPLASRSPQASLIRSRNLADHVRQLCVKFPNRVREANTRNGKCWVIFPLWQPAPLSELNPVS